MPNKKAIFPCKLETLVEIAKLQPVQTERPKIES